MRKPIHEGFRTPVDSGRGEHLHRGDIDMIINLYKEGVKVAFIAHKCGCSRATVNSVARRNNIEKRQPGSGRWRKGKVNNNV